jgi:hypothetical protein
MVRQSDQRARSRQWFWINKLALKNVVTVVSLSLYVVALLSITCCCNYVQREHSSDRVDHCLSGPRIEAWSSVSKKIERKEAGTVCV